MWQRRVCSGRAHRGIHCRAATDRGASRQGRETHAARGQPRQPASGAQTRGHCHRQGQPCSADVSPHTHHVCGAASTQHRIQGSDTATRRACDGDRQGGHVRLLQAWGHCARRGAESGRRALLLPQHRQERAGGGVRQERGGRCRDGAHRVDHHAVPRDQQRGEEEGGARGRVRAESGKRVYPPEARGVVVSVCPFKWGRRALMVAAVRTTVDGA